MVAFKNIRCIIHRKKKLKTCENCRYQKNGHYVEPCKTGRELLSQQRNCFGWQSKHWWQRLVYSLKK